MIYTLVFYWIVAGLVIFVDFSKFNRNRSLLFELIFSMLMGGILVPIKLIAELVN